MLRIKRTRKTKFSGAALLALLAVFGLNIAGAAPPKSLAAGEAPDATENIPFEEVPSILRSARDWGLPPTVCFKHESEIDRTFASGDGCSTEKFFGFACAQKSTKVRACIN